MKKELGSDRGRLTLFVLIFYFIGAAFVAPTELVQNGGIVDIVSHMIGFALGFYTTEFYLGHFAYMKDL